MPGLRPRGSLEKWLSRLDARVLAAVVPIAVAVVLGVRQIRRLDALVGLNEYDDGVYIASAIRLARGVLPYQDFAFPHPPGIPLLFAPLAWLLRHASQRTLLGATRIITIAISICNVALIAYLMRRRHWVGILAAALSFAVFPLAVTANKALLLEPYVVFFVLAGLAVVLDGESWSLGRRRFAGWVLLGFAITVKLWAVVPVVVLLLLARKNLRRSWKAVVAGIGVGGVLPMLPFFVAAPSGFVRQVVTLQVERGKSFGALSVPDRLVFVTGFRSYPDLPGGSRWAVLLVLLFVAAVGGPMLLRARLTVLDRFAAGASVATVVLLLVSSDFFMHYGYFTAAFLALAGGCAAGAVADMISQRPSIPATARRVVLGALAVSVGVAGAIAVDRGLGIVEEHPGILTVGDPGPRVAELIPVGSCVVTDEVSLLINANRLASNAGCPAAIDSFYEWLRELPDRPPPNGPPYPEALVGRWRRWFEAADYALLSPNTFRVPWTPELTAWFEANFEQIGNPGPVVYVRTRTGGSAGG